MPTGKELDLLFGPKRSDQTESNFAAHTTLVRRLIEDARPKNSKLAYDKKMDEFLEFCSVCFEDEYPNQFIVTEEKLYQCLFTVSRREKRKTRAKQRTNAHGQHS